MTTALDPNYNWKAAASQESVDYEAVNKSFMDQAYGMVANKAPKLFADPYRLGFEIVYRNEKATKMIGDFLFRVNGDILQVPVFFINGETKPADMLYRGGVKRMVPFTARWVDFLIKGADGDAGELVDRSRMRQRDLHGERLSVPRYTKYATENFTRLEDDGFLDEAPLEDGEPGAVLKWATEEFGPVVMEKLADWLENAPRALAYVSENYDLSSYTTKAAANEVVAPASALRLVTNLAQSKSASTTDWITRDGFAVVDDRHEFAVNPVVEEEPCADYTDIKDSGYAKFKLSDGKDIAGVVYRIYELPDQHTQRPTRTRSYSRLLVFEDGQSLRLTDNDAAFGQLLACIPPVSEGVKISEVSEGGMYLVAKDGGLNAWGPFRVTSKTTPKEGSVLLDIENQWGSQLDKLQYAPGKNHSYPEQGLLTEDARFIKLQVTKEPETSNKCFPSSCGERLKSEYKLMSSSQIDRWMRTGFGNDVDVIEVSTVKNAFDNYDVVVRQYRDDVRTKICTNTSKIQTIVKLATELGMHADEATKLLSSATVDKAAKTLVIDVLRDKKAYTTRVETLRDIPNSVDPQTRLRVEHPDTQILATYTPERFDQKARYGDKMDLARPANDAKHDDLKHKLPLDMIHNAKPEELAQHAQELGLSSIFDHGAIASMSKSVFDVSEQIRQYIPQLEAAVDRYYRILFLMRYRTADFEENFGKEEVMEMEATLASLAKETGENLLDLIERFRPDIGANAS